MDYEKKYKEALTRAESFYRNGKGSTKSMVYTIFPELKESEDERISKETKRGINYETALERNKKAIMEDSM